MLSEEHRCPRRTRHLSAAGQDTRPPWLLGSASSPLTSGSPPRSVQAEEEPVVAWTKAAAELGAVADLPRPGEQGRSEGQLLGLPVREGGRHVTTGGLQVPSQPPAVLGRLGRAGGGVRTDGEGRVP